MSHLSIPFPHLFGDFSIKALRIDVRHSAAGVQDELDALHERLNQPGPLFQLPCVGIDLPGFAFRYREADGEHYVYVEDLAAGRLAGYTCFNRLVELNRRADRHLRAPHSKYAPAYQRRGIATAVYRWWLESGRCLITGARQSDGANALWHSLGRHYDMVYVQLRNKELALLGPSVSSEVLGDLHTRILLLAKDWSLEGVAGATGMTLPRHGREGQGARVPGR